MSANETALDILKIFLDLVYTCTNIRIVYANYPSICIEYTGKDFKMSLSHLDNYTPIFLKSEEQLYFFICKASNEKRLISRIEVNNKNIIAVIYGDLYTHELNYSKDKIVNWNKLIC